MTSLDTAPSQHFEAMDVDDAVEEFNHSRPDIIIPEQSQPESCSTSSSSSSSISASSGTAAVSVTDIPSEPPKDIPSEPLMDIPSQPPMDIPSEPPMDMTSETLMGNPSETVIENPSETLIDNLSESINDSPSVTISDNPSKIIIDNLSETTNDNPSVPATINNNLSESMIENSSKALNLCQSIVESSAETYVNANLNESSVSIPTSDPLPEDRNFSASGADSTGTVSSNSNITGPSTVSNGVPVPSCLQQRPASTIDQVHHGSTTGEAQQHNGSETCRISTSSEAVTASRTIPETGHMSERDTLEPETNSAPEPVPMEAQIGPAGQMENAPMADGEEEDRMDQSSEEVYLQPEDVNMGGGEGGGMVEVAPPSSSSSSSVVTLVRRPHPLPVCLDEEEMDDGTNENNVISIPDDGESSEDLGMAHD